MDTKNIVDQKIFWSLFMVAEFSMIAAVPYAVSISGDAIYEFGASLPTLLATQFAQGTVLLIISILTGIFLGKKVGLGAPILESLFRGRGLPAETNSSLKLSIVLGVFVGTAFFVVDRFVFSMFTDPVTVFLSSPPLWQRFLYSFYVGIIEEIVMRFFLVTLLVWISWKIKKTSENRPANTGVWISILAVSIIYIIGYILSLPTSMDSNHVLGFGIVLLSMIAGVIFGWLYWKKGLEASIIANVTAMITLVVVLGSL
ncbi:CPBP family glutamic-type intramembrane protease [Methanolobus sp. ZRKC2]|uniref:CPBP family glutamic-type intramembrane protease n=1 Tax=Methanolobus sp. ZRKC2 TaxID=3125783 RepID=UPI003253775F